MFARIFTNKNGCLTKDSVILTIQNLLIDFNINLAEMPKISPENFNFIQLAYELEFTHKMPVIPINLEIEKRLDFEYSGQYVNNGEHLTNKWQLDSENSKFTIFINNFVNKTKYLTKLINNISDINEYTNYKHEIELHAKEYKKIQQQFTIKNEVNSIYNGINLIYKNLEYGIKNCNNIKELAISYISELNLLIKRNNDCMFYFHKIKNKPKIFKGLEILLDPTNIESINNIILQDKEQKQKQQDILNIKNTQIQELELEIENLTTKVSTCDNKQEITNMQVKIYDLNDKIVNIESEKNIILNSMQSSSNNIQIDNIIYKIATRMEDPNYFNEDYYIKLGYYFPEMQIFKKNHNKKLELNTKINKINSKKHDIDTIAIMNTEATLDKQSELGNKLNAELSDLNTEFKLLLKSIPNTKYPIATEILNYAKENNINIVEIVNIN